MRILFTISSSSPLTNESFWWQFSIFRKESLLFYNKYYNWLWLDSTWMYSDHVWSALLPLLFCYFIYLTYWVCSLKSSKSSKMNQFPEMSKNSQESLRILNIYIPKISKNRGESCGFFEILWDSLGFWMDFIQKYSILIEKKSLKMSKNPQESQKSLWKSLRILNLYPENIKE